MTLQQIYHTSLIFHFEAYLFGISVPPQFFNIDDLEQALASSRGVVPQYDIINESVLLNAAIQWTFLNAKS